MGLFSGLFDVVVDVTTHSGNSTSWTDITNHGGNDFDSWDW